MNMMRFASARNDVQEQEEATEEQGDSEPKQLGEVVLSLPTAPKELGKKPTGQRPSDHGEYHRRSQKEHSAQAGEQSQNHVPHEGLDPSLARRRTPHSTTTT